MIDPVLAALWARVHHNPAWLSALIEVGLPMEDILALSDYDERMTAIPTREIRQWLQNSAAHHREIDVDRSWARERRREYLSDRIADLRTRLIDERRSAGRSLMAGNEDDYLLGKERIEETERKLQRLERALGEMSAEAPAERGGHISEDMIAAARSRDIRQVVDAPKNMVRCPWHKEGQEKSPSMSVAKGYGYCFTCRKSANAIDWLMQVEGMDFAGAVRRLA